MKLRLPWVSDPSTNKASVSLTNLVISILLLVVVTILHVLGKVKDTSIVMEYFGISSALYFSRRLNIKNNAYSSEESDKK